MPRILTTLRAAGTATALASCLCLVAACSSDDGGNDDNGTDTDMDTQMSDTGDTGSDDTSDDPETDTTTDGGPVDTGGQDTTPTDTETDSGPTDTGPTDTGPTDTGPTDTGTDTATDTGPTDTGTDTATDTTTDTGPVDTGPDVDPPLCPAPGDADSGAVAALDHMNGLRTAMGIQCATMHTTINDAARLHCEYYAANSGSCISNAHGEVEGCDLFVASSFADRMRMAGYTGSPRFEDMHFVNDPIRATQGWIDSIWHRTPVLSPWIADVGYGTAAGCDTMDFGRGEQLPADTVAMYPYDGQVDVPTSFNGREGPPPPEPPTGWPSGYPVTLYAQNATIETHTLVVEGTSANIPHVWLTPADSSLLSTEYFMYANDPLEAATTYQVIMSGTQSGEPFNASWTFTTR